MLTEPNRTNYPLKTLTRTYIVIALLISWLPGISQTSISGTINKYAKVITINGTDNVTVDTVSNFKQNDTIMIIQMKGAEIDTLNNLLIQMNYTGRYEFIAVQQVDYGTKVIKFQSNFINTYDATQAVQLVRVPSYQNAKVNGQLYCDPWDGSKGGVLAFIVEDTLDLQSDISASGLGFRGGASTYDLTSKCYLSKKRYYLGTASDSAGFKGEGIIETSFLFTRGRGGIGNAGGGGNGFGSGGGGGSGSSSGGSGGQASTSKTQCNVGIRSTGFEGGEGGKSNSNYYPGKNNDPDLRDHIFMGGGGGSSRGTNPGNASAGGNGGGIIFILANNFKNKNGYFIKSNGADALQASNDAGGGGGGGGGSVMLAINTPLDPLNVEVKGGKGGNADCTGLGGGGGAGFVWFADKSLPFSTLSLSPGNAGGYTLPICSGPVPGVNGTKSDSAASYLNPVLNGFLFNLIGTAQTICYGDAPKKFTATNPRGGNGVYTYKWQYRNKSTANKWTYVAGANSIDYQSVPLTDTTDFRRIVSTTHISTASTISDSSKWIRIKVRPEIKGVSIAPSDTAMCMYQNPIKIRGSMASGGDGTSLIYLWEQSPDNSPTSWSAVTPGPSDQKDYANTSNQITRYYSRTVKNNTCTVTSNSAIFLGKARRSLAPADFGSICNHII